MLRVLVVGLCAIVIAGGVRAQAPAAGAEEAAVREVVRRYVEARERRDGGAIAALFTDDADQFTTSGEWRRGREAIVEGALASSQRNPGSRSITVESVRFPAAGVAIADGGYAITAAAGRPARRMWTTIVLTRGQDGWRIAAIRNAVPQGPQVP